MCSRQRRARRSGTTAWNPTLRIRAPCSLQRHCHRCWRSIDTACIIAAPHQLEVQTTPLLRERDWGGFTGRYIPDLKGEVWPDDIETLENLLSRAGEFIAYIRDTYPGKKVVAVGHGIINKAIQAVYYSKPMSEVQRMSNAEVRILEL